MADTQPNLQNYGGAPGTSYHSPGLKNVGDGALSDSDSSGNEEDREDGPGGEDELESTPDPANDEGLEGDLFRRPRASPYQFPRNPHSHRSPLSKIVKQQGWMPGEDEDHVSPSPASSDSDHGSFVSPTMKRVFPAPSTGVSFYSTNRKRSNTTNRSSMVTGSVTSPSVGPVTGAGGGTGGLAVPKKTILKQESQSSIRTVIAVSENATPTKEVPDPYSSYSQGGPGTRLSETPRKVSNGESKNGSTGRPFAFGHQKQLSEAAMSELFLDDRDDSRSQSQSQRGGLAFGKHVQRQSEKVMTKRREDVEEAERRFRDSGWDVVKESLEIYAEEVCSVMSLWPLSGLTFGIGGDTDVCDVIDDRLQGVGNPTVACNFFRGILFRSVPLTVSQTRTHVLAELLTRLQLHVPAADIRKHIELEEIKSNALVEPWRTYTYLPH